MIKWSDLPKEADETIDKIMKRLEGVDMDVDSLSIRMSLSAAKIYDPALNYEKLLSSKEFDFMHDIFGILNNACHNSGKLKGTFLPRCAR